VFRVVIYDISYTPLTAAVDPVASDPVASDPVTPKPLECTVCKKKFEKKSRLKVHLRENHINPKAKCDICGRSYTRISSLKFHMNQKHINKNPDKSVSFDETSSNRKSRK
jgi:hypothetical protein